MDQHYSEEKHPDIDTIINEIMLRKGLRHLYQVADFFEVTAQTLSGWIKQNKIPPKHLLKYYQDVQSSASEDSQYSVSESTLASTRSFENERLSLARWQLLISHQLRYLIGIPFFILIPLAVYLFFIAQPIYRTTAVILPTEQSSSSAANLLGVAAQIGINVPLGLDNETAWNELYPEIVRSKRLKRTLLNEVFNTNRYGLKSNLLEILSIEAEIEHRSLPERIEACTKILDQMIILDNPRLSPVVTLEVFGFEPEFTVELANRVIYHSGRLQREYKTSQVQKKRAFLEERILEVNTQVINIEEELRSFREQNRLLQKSPNLILQEERFEQDLSLQRSLMITLQTLYEQAKIEEVEKAAMIQVIDEPLVPWEHFRPKRGLWLIIMSIFSFLFAFSVAYIKEFLLADGIAESRLRRVARTKMKENLKSLIPLKSS